MLHERYEYVMKQCWPMGAKNGEFHFEPPELPEHAVRDWEIDHVDYVRDSVSTHHSGAMNERIGAQGMVAMAYHPNHTSSAFTYCAMVVWKRLVTKTELDLIQEAKDELEAKWQAATQAEIQALMSEYEDVRNRTDALEIERAVEEEMATFS